MALRVWEVSRPKQEIQKHSNFFSPAAGCYKELKEVYIAICPPPKKAPNFFRLRRAVTKMCIWLLPPLQKAPNFFRLRRAVTKMSIYFPQKPPIFFACGGLLLRCVYGYCHPFKKSPIFSPAEGCYKDAHPAREKFGVKTTPDFGVSFWVHKWKI